MGNFRVVKLLDNPVQLVFTGGVNPRGDYNNLTAYVTGDSVSYQGSSYVAIQATTGNLPTDTTYWQLLAEKGDVGPQGPAGVQGKIPQLNLDPVAPSDEEAWVKRNTTVILEPISHTLLQIGLTAPGDTIIYDYQFKYRTKEGTTVSVPLT